MPHDHRGRDGQGIGVGFWISLPLWLGLIALLFQA